MNLPTEIAAAPALSSFVRCYAFRQFDTQGKLMVEPLHALHEMCLTIYQAGPVPMPHCINGVATQCNGVAFYRGAYSLFIIHFKPNGFYKIFGLPPKAFLNKTVDAETVLGEPLQQYAGAVKNLRDKKQIAAITNSFLLQQMAARTGHERCDAITAASNIIANSPGVSIEQLAHYVNMSLRNFERRFDEQVGIPPKLYGRIHRFNDALLQKLNGRVKEWASIAQVCGYFDQMHLIKDFKQFAGYSPSAFMKRTANAPESLAVQEPEFV